MAMRPRFSYVSLPFWILTFALLDPKADHVVLPLSHPLWSRRPQLSGRRLQIRTYWQMLLCVPMSVRSGLLHDENVCAVPLPSNLYHYKQSLGHKLVDHILLVFRLLAGQFLQGCLRGSPRQGSVGVSTKCPLDPSYRSILDYRNNQHYLDGSNPCFANAYCLGHEDVSSEESRTVRIVCSWMRVRLNSMLD